MNTVILLLILLLLMSSPVMSDPEVNIFIIEIINIGFMFAITLGIGGALFLLGIIGITYANTVKSKGKKFGLFTLNSLLLVAFLTLTSFIWPNTGYWLQIICSLGALIVCNTPVALYLSDKKNKEDEEASKKDFSSAGRGFKIY